MIKRPLVNPFHATEGWLELGNLAEAAEELHRLPPSLKSSVEFCKLWVRIYTDKGAWSNVELMCETLSKHVPDDPFTIYNQAEAFHRQGRSQEAYTIFKYAPVSFKQGADYLLRHCSLSLRPGANDDGLGLFGEGF